MSKPSMLDRFWAKVEKSSGCWLWQAAKDERGYGRFGVGSHGARLAHRVSWELVNGPLPHGMWVLHRCDTPSCVNPNHMFLGTHEDNMEDMAAKGRGRKNHPTGERAYRAKLTLEQAQEIRRLRASGMTQIAVAQQFGIHRGTVQEITKGRTYA